MVNNLKGSHTPVSGFNFLIPFVITLLTLDEPTAIHCAIASRAC